MKDAKGDKDFPQVSSGVSRIDPEKFYGKTESEGNSYQGVYTQQGLHACFQGDRVENVELLLDSDESRTCCITGEPGQGKTTTLKKIYLEAVKNTVRYLSLLHNYLRKIH